MKIVYDKELFKRYYKDIIKNIILLIVISILSIVGPLLLKRIIDYNIQQGFNVRILGIYIIVLTFLYVIKFLQNRFRFWFAEKFKNFETVNLYQKIFRISYEKINQMEPTYIAERVGSTVDTIFNLYCSSLTGIFVSALTMLLILIVVAGMNPWLAIMYFLQVPLQYFGFQKLLNGEKSKLSTLGNKLQTVRAKNNKDIKAVVSDVNSIKQHSYANGLISFIKRCVKNINSTEREGNTYAMDICTALEYFSQILKNGSYIYIIYLYVTARVSIGDLVYLNLINDIYYNSIGNVINIQVNLRDLHGATKFVTDEIEKNYESDGHIEIGRIESISGTISNIGYDNDTLITEGKFEFVSGDVIALTGKSGSGKSTFVKLLNKFIESKGILVNGYHLSDISNHSLRKRVFYLAQTSYLLPFSIKENIALGESYSSEKWNELLKMEFMEKFICHENGLDAIVYENAANLSGGDKQKIMLGRIFLQDPDIIILDESFSAIDEETGEEIIDRIVKMYHDRIVIIISHSDKFLRNCNKKMIIEDKKLFQIT